MGGSKNVHILQMFSTYNLQRSFEDSSSEEFVLGVVPGRRRWQKLMTKRKSKKNYTERGSSNVRLSLYIDFGQRGRGVSKSPNIFADIICASPLSQSAIGGQKLVLCSQHPHRLRPLRGRLGLSTSAVSP